MTSDDKSIKQLTEGEGKALIRERQKVKQLEKAVDDQACGLGRLRKENAKQKSKIDKLKQQLAAVRKPPQWTKANKPEDDKGKSGKKKRPKNFHKPNIR